MRTHRLIIYTLIAIISLARIAQSQDLIGFDRGSFGSVVLSQKQSLGTDFQLELSIGSYENEPIINYSVGSVFAQIGKSVGRLDVLTDKGLFPCTAFIVSKKYILTNYHCSLGLLDDERIGATRIDATQFVAGYLQTGIEAESKKYTVIPTPKEYSKRLDYAVLEVIGDPSQEYGQLKLANITPNDGDPFWIIGHPMGEGQRISREKCKANNPALSGGKLLHTCDTLPGNSGSPVIDAGLQQVVGLHHAGSRKDSVNYAILMSEILDNSKILKAYKAPKALPVKTTETNSCDALYNAAANAKACYAYDVYIERCPAHALAPMASGYIKEFCQLKVVEKDSNRSKPEKVKEQTCSEDVKKCKPLFLCRMATEKNNLKTVWETSVTLKKYVIEAKKRRLSCGVKTSAMVFDKKNIDDVKNLQNTLNSIGCNAGYVDGVWGKKTIAAVLQFAKKADLFTSSDNLITDQLLSALSKAKKGFCPKPEIPSHWIAKQSCEKLDEPIIWTLNTQKSSKNKYSYSSPSDSSAVGIFEIMGNRIKITDFNDDGTKNLMQGSISSDRKNIDIFVNMDKFDLGNCTLKLKGVNHDFRFMPITSGLDYNQKMYGIAKCTNGMNSQNIKVKAFNDFWADKSGEYLTTRYHFNDEGLVWTHRFACYNKEFCLGKRYGNIILKRGEISLEIKTPKWGQCQISIK